MMIKKMLHQINPDQESPIDNMILMVSYKFNLFYFIRACVDPEVHQSIRIDGG